MLLATAPSVHTSAVAGRGWGLLQAVHTNGALVTTAAGTDTRIVPTTALTAPDGLRQAMWSASWVGTFVPDTSTSGHFLCRTTGGRITAWVDDRLVCTTTPCEPKGRCDVGGGHDAEVNGTWPHWDPIPLRQAQNHTIYIRFVRDQATALDVLPSFEMLWARWPPTQMAQPPRFAAIPTAMLRPWSSPAEQERTSVQAAVGAGWGPWFRNDMLTQMHLPDMLGVSTALVQRSTQQREGGVPLNGSFYGAIPRCPCYKGGPVSNSTGAGTWSGGKGSDPVTCDSASADILPWPRSNPTVRVGPLAWDKSYSQLFVQWKGFNVSFETATTPSALDTHHGAAAGSRKDLIMSITVVAEPGPAPTATTPATAAATTTTTTTTNRSDFVIGLGARFFFSRPGAVRVVHNESTTLLVGTPQGLPPHVFALLAGQVASASSSSLSGGSFPLAIELPKQGSANSIVLTSSPTVASADEARGIVLERRAHELARYERYQHLAEAKEQVQTVLGWNAIYVPYERGVVVPVTRRCDKGYGYALFNWDSMFAAWMLGLDNSSVALGLSHFVQAVQGRTERGFFSSFRTGMIQTRDKSQPPVASRVALELYKRHGASVTWMLELLWSALASNNDFFWDTRRDPATDLVRLGSDPGFAGRCAGRCLKQDLQHARYESGLDNSPTLDGTDGQSDSASAWYDFGPLTFNATTHRTGFYDVGNTALHAFDCAALSELAGVLGRPADVAKYNERHLRVAAAIQSRLWDNVTNSFVQLISEGPGNQLSIYCFSPRICSRTLM